MCKILNDKRQGNGTYLGKKEREREDEGDALPYLIPPVATSRVEIIVVITTIFSTAH